MKTKVMDVGVKLDEDEDIDLDEEFDDEDEDMEDDDEDGELSIEIDTILTVNTASGKDEWYVSEAILESVLEVIEREDPCISLLTEEGGTLYQTGNIQSLKWRRLTPEEDKNAPWSEWRRFVIIEVF